MAFQGDPMPSSPGRKRIGRVLAGLVVLVIAVLFGAMTYQFIWGGRDGHQLTTLDPQGNFAKSIQDLVDPVFALGMLVGIAVIAVIGFIAYRFRDHGSDPDEFPVQLHGKTSFEIGWTALPALILAGGGGFTVLTLIDLNKPAPEALKVEVSGQQWWWGFHYDLNSDGDYQGSGDL